MGRRRAFLIGNQNFRSDSGFAPLLGPANDVAALARVLRAPDRGNFETRCFADQTRDTILIEIEEALNEAGAADLVLLFYAGHGMLDRSGRLCLATADTRGSALLTTSIPTGLLRDMVETADCGTVILLLDCCFSGQAGIELTRGNVASQIALMGDTSGLYVLTASARSQTAKEAETESDGLTMGRLTAAMVQGIETGEADCNKDGLVSINDLNSYLRMTVRGQTPEFSARQTSGDPVIATLRPPETSVERRRRRLGEWLAADLIPYDLYQPLIDAAEGQADSRSVMVVQRLLDREETTPAAVIGGFYGAQNTRQAGGSPRSSYFDPLTPDADPIPEAAANPAGAGAEKQAAGADRAGGTDTKPPPAAKPGPMNASGLRHWLIRDIRPAMGIGALASVVFLVLSTTAPVYRRPPAGTVIALTFAMNALATFAVIAGVRTRLRRRFGDIALAGHIETRRAYLLIGGLVFSIVWFICLLAATNR